MRKLLLVSLVLSICPLLVHCSSSAVETTLGSSQAALPLDPAAIEGYTDVESYVAGGVPSQRTVRLHVHNLGAGPFRIEWYRYGTNGGNPPGKDSVGKWLRTDTYAAGAATGQTMDPSNGFRDGANWPLLAQLPVVNESWGSGLYAMKLVNAYGSFYVPLVLRPATYSGVVVVASTNTWHAYNGWGGGSYYSPGPGYCTLDAAESTLFDTVSTRRPLGFGADPNNSVGNPVSGPDHLVHGEVKVLEWLQAKGIAYSLITDRDLSNAAVLNPAYLQALVLSTHSEYWTDAAKNNLDTYLKAGGHLISLAGDVMDWRVSYGGTNTTMVTTKFRRRNVSSPCGFQKTGGGALADLAPPVDGSSLYDYVYGNAENSAVLGSLSMHGENEANGPYVIDDAHEGDDQHWLLAGTGVARAATCTGTAICSFGHTSTFSENNACGSGTRPCKAAAWETDGVPKNGLSTGGIPHVVATGRDDVHALPVRGASMFYLGRPHGGGGFVTGSLMFGQSLAGELSLSLEGPLTTIVKNAITRAQRPMPFQRGDFDGDGDRRADLYCYGPSSGTVSVFRAGAAGGGTGFDTTANPKFTGWCQTPKLLGTGDFNGDRMTDFFCHDGAAGTVSLALSSGTGFSYTTNAITGFWCGGAWSTLLAADVDGDAKSDLICHNGDGGTYGGTTWVARSNGTSFGTASTWQTGFCSYRGSEFGVGDFDGDGRADVWCHDTASENPGSTWVAQSNGTSFIQRYGGNKWSSTFCNWPGLKFGVGDFNADGLTDVYCHDGAPGDYNDGNTFVALSNGGGAFQDTGLWLGGWCWGSATGGEFGVGDFDGDGRDDIFCRNKTNGDTWIAKATPKVNSDLAQTVTGQFLPQSAYFPGLCPGTDWRLGSSF